MKLTWKKEKNVKKRPFGVVSQYPNLPFEQQNNEFDTELGSRGEPGDDEKKAVASVESSGLDTKQLAKSFREQGDKLAEEGKYREALEKWEAALNLMPDTAALHEQKAQVLLEIGDAWSALKAATRATDLEPSWAEAWITLGRSQLNFGEPDSAIDSFDRALALKPDSKEAKEDRETAMHHIKRRKQLHSSGLSSDNNRFMVGDKTVSS